MREAGERESGRVWADVIGVGGDGEGERGTHRADACTRNVEQAEVVLVALPAGVLEGGGGAGGHEVVVALLEAAATQ